MIEHSKHTQTHTHSFLSATLFPHWRHNRGEHWVVSGQKFFQTNTSFSQLRTRGSSYMGTPSNVRNPIRAPDRQEEEVLFFKRPAACPRPGWSQGSAGPGQTPGHVLWAHSSFPATPMGGPGLREGHFHDPNKRTNVLIRETSNFIYQPGDMIFRILGVGFRCLAFERNRLSFRVV